MFPNITRDHGIRAIRRKLLDRDNETPSVECIIDVFEIIRTCSDIQFKVTPTLFWLKCKKNRLMHWQIRAQFLCCILESWNSNFACGNRCTHVILLPIGPQQSLLMTIKRIWDLNFFPSSLKAPTSNFRILFVGSLVFNLRFKKFPNHRFFLIQQKILSTPTDDKYELI